MDVKKQRALLAASVAGLLAAAGSLMTQTGQAAEGEPGGLPHRVHGAVPQALVSVTMPV